MNHSEIFSENVISFKFSLKKRLLKMKTFIAKIFLKLYELYFEGEIEGASSSISNRIEKKIFGQFY